MSVEKNKLKGKELLSFLAILTLGLGGATSTTMSAVLTVVQAHFSDIPYGQLYLLVTTPSMLSMILNTLWGSVIGRKIPYRPVLIGGLTCFLVGGVGPAFFPGSGFATIMVFRVIFGIGLGSIGFSYPIVMTTYDGQQQAKYLSFLTLFYNISSMTVASCSGLLGAISYQATYAIYLVGVIPFVLIILFFKEPEFSLANIAANKAIKAGQADAETKEKTKFRINPLAMFWTIMSFVFLLFKYPLAMQASIFAEGHGIVNATIVGGTLYSVYQAGGFVGSAIFPTLNKLINRWLMPLYMLLITINISLCMLCNNLVIFYIAYFIGGLGYNSTSLVKQTFVGAINEKSSMAFMASLSTALQYAAIYASPLYISVANSIAGGVTGTHFEYNNWYVAMVFFAVMTVVFFVKDPRPKKYKEMMEAEFSK